MYNEEVKQNFIRACKSYSEDPNIEKSLEIIFKGTESFEMKWEKDACDFNIEQICTYLSSRLSRSYSLLYKTVTYLRQYGDFCLNRKLIKDNQNHYNELDKQTILSCINTDLINSAYITREELLELINSGQIINAREKFIMLAIFEGIGGSLLEELINLKTEDFHEQKVKLLTGKELEISNILSTLASEAYEAEYEYPISTNMDELSDPEKCPAKILLRKDSSYIIKPRKNARGDKTTYSAIKVMLNTYCANLDITCLSIHALKISGIIEMCKNFMAEKNLTAKEVYSDSTLTEQIFYRYGKFRTDNHLLQYGSLYE